MTLLRPLFRPFSSFSRFYSAGGAGGAGGVERHATTILAVRKGNSVTLVGDGQVTQGSITIKPNVKKVRHLSNDVVAGFAGSTADCLALLERLEGKLEEYPGQLQRACVELAKAWRTEKYLRHLQASIIVADQNLTLEVTGSGDVLESHDDVLAIGSGSPYAAAAARAICNLPEEMIRDLSSKDIAVRAMTIAADMCVYTNGNFTVKEVLKKTEEKAEQGG